MPRPTEEIDSLFRSLDWRVTGAGRFSRTSHINIQEARALKTDIRRVSMLRLCEPLATLQHTVGTRALYGIDSRVVCGKVRKGRSSSYRLNGVQRTLTGYLLAARILPCLIWVGTKSNSSDHPSRGAPLPAPEPPPAWAAPHLAPMVRAADVVPHARAAKPRPVRGLGGAPTSCCSDDGSGSAWAQQG